MRYISSVCDEISEKKQIMSHGVYIMVGEERFYLNLDTDMNQLMIHIMKEN